MKSYFPWKITLGLLLFSSCVFAEVPYNNFYVGANVGLASLYDKQSTDNPIPDSHYLSTVGLIGGVLVGYDFTLKDQYKLGLEGFANGTDLSLSTKQNYAPVTSYTVKMQYNAGLRILPGYELTPATIAELILGYAYGRFNIHDNGNYGLISNTFSKNGLQYGLGLKTAICKNFSLRADVLYTNYFSQTSNGVTTSTPSGIQTYHNNLATLEGNLALIYKFS